MQSDLEKFYKHQLIWICISVLYLTLLTILLIDSPLRADENHNIATIKLFHDNFTLNQIKDYPEVTPPLFYFAYALWAKIFGFAIINLRLLSIVIAFMTFQALYSLSSIFIKNQLHNILILLMIILNPYFIGISIFIYTDMITIFFLTLGVISFIKGKYILFFIGSSMALLTRQYAIILPLAIFSYLILEFLIQKKLNLKKFISASLSLLPILILFFVWNGITPPSGKERWIVEETLNFSFNYLNTYLTFSVIYIIPLLLIYLIRKFKFNIKEILIALAFTIVLSFFPVSISKVTLLQTETKTVGFAHLFLTQIFHDELILRLILLLFLFLSLWLNLILLKEYISQIKDRVLEKGLIFHLLWICFLVIMPLSYQVWEKYLTMVLPFYSLSIYLVFSVCDKVEGEL